MAERILPLQLDEAAGDAYREKFESHGCRFLLGKKASETVMNADGAIEAVILDDGTRINCDLVIVAAGVRPAIECVQGSNIKSERFIEVNSHMETSCPHVYAAGDVAGLSGIWPNAMKQGETAAYNMCGTERFIEVNSHMETSCPHVYAAGDVAGLSGIWPNAMKQGETAAYNMCGTEKEYTDLYAMKNTMNFYGITTLSLGRGVAEEGDEVIYEKHYEFLWHYYSLTGPRRRRRRG